MQLIITTNIIPFISLLFLLFFAFYNPVFTKRQTILFIISIVINMTMILVISTDYCLSLIHEPGIYIFRRITSFLNFTAGPLVPFMLLSIFNREKLKLSSYLPLLINTLFCFLSIFFHIIFFISYNNTYGRGPLFFLPVATSIIYILKLLLIPNPNLTKSKINERAFLLCVILVLIFTMYLEIIQGYLFLSWAFTAIGLILCYLFLVINSFIIDPLTKIYNRAMYAKALTLIENNKSCILTLLDINNLKKATSKLGTLYRIGGMSLLFSHLLECSRK